MGYQALLRRDYDKAIEYLTRAIEIGDWPEWQDWYLHRGLVFGTFGRHDDAIADYDTALHLHARFVNALVARAEAHLAKGEHEGAAADFQRAVELDREVDRQLSRSCRKVGTGGCDSLAGLLKRNARRHKGG